MKTDNPGGFPIELYKFNEQKIAFKIIVKLSTFAPYTRYYNISNWTDNMEIIAELEKIESKKTLSEQVLFTFIKLYLNISIIHNIY